MPSSSVSTSNASSGSLAKVKRNHSVVTLTTPQLYSIYGGGGNDIDEDDDSLDIYAKLPENIVKSSSNRASAKPVKIPPPPLIIRASKFLLKCLTLCLVGNLFVKLTEEIYKSNPTLPNLADYGIFYIFRKSLSMAEFTSIASETNGATKLLTKIEIDILNNSMTGLILGSIQPLVEALAFRNPTSKSNTTLFDPSSILRSTAALIGLSFLLKKLQWPSKLEASLIWCSINSLLWFILDATLTGFVSALVGSLLSMAIYVATDTRLIFSDLLFNYDTFADLLWIGSSLFISLIVFGKISKHLFN